MTSVFLNSWLRPCRKLCLDRGDKKTSQKHVKERIQQMFSSALYRSRHSQRFWWLSNSAERKAPPPFNSFNFLCFLSVRAARHEVRLISSSGTLKQTKGRDTVQGSVWSAKLATWPLIGIPLGQLTNFSSSLCFHVKKNCNKCKSYSIYQIFITWKFCIKTEFVFGTNWQDVGAFWVNSRAGKLLWKTCLLPLLQGCNQWLFSLSIKLLVIFSIN